MSNQRSLSLTMPHLKSKRSRLSSGDAKLAATTTKPSSSVHSFDSILSEPATPTWSVRGHGRYPSSNSSVASNSSPCADLSELCGSTSRLSKLAEEPPEPEDDCIIMENDDQQWSCLCDAQPCVHTTVADQPQSMKSPIFGLSDSFYAEADGGLSRSSSFRRRSPDADTSSIASKFTQRFPSLSRRWMQRKPTLAVATGYVTTSRRASSRSSSLSSNAVPGLESLDALSESVVQSPGEPIDSIQTSPAVDIPSTEHPLDPIDRAAFASTPLLPPLIDEAKPIETPLQSPLQSPTVADTSVSLSALNSPVDTPQFEGIPTPMLSQKPSIVSLRNARSAALPTSEIPPLLMSDPNDPWAMKLGHANFTIHPEPYLPLDFTAASVAQLFSDWEQARCNFTKHQHRTSEHFGITSKTYMLTDEKWAEIDAHWKQNYEFATAEASRGNGGTLPHTPDEPAPLMKIPSFNDPKASGKFPTLGDEDIVGPMVQAAAPILPKSPSRTRSLFKLLSNLKIPTAAAVRPEATLRRSG